MLSDSPRLYTIGTFDDRVTVLSQQRRALNLAWSLIESRRLPTRADEKRLKVAIIGTGFAGLTFAAALIQKRCRCDISLFEERDTLLPLQQGSDTRWLHPHIYDWPEEGSDSAAAMLPVLNWTAARASDVVVQVLSSWKELVERNEKSIKLYCNTRHLQIRPPSTNSVLVEWVGENRLASDGSSLPEGSGAKGQSAEFDVVVLAVGFGLEADNPSSYWRNEILGQPSLSQPRRTFLISGQGDGAMIDLLRLKISQFRQDRILAELFYDKRELLDELRRLRADFLAGEPDFPLFDRFEALCRKRKAVGRQMKLALVHLSTRLRRDTEIVLKLRVRNFADLLTAKTSRTSFQNALLVFLLYRCGGFAPSWEDELELIPRFGISPENVIRRHGTKRLEQLRRLLPPAICDPIEKCWADNRCADFRQTAEIQWKGGYFGAPGRQEDFDRVDDKLRKTWRKEYLPGPTSLLASSISGAVSGAIARLRRDAKHFRVTLHRVLAIQREELLQQACDYVGRNLRDAASTAGRTFPANNATIGLAYRTRAIVRSRPGIEPAELNEAMQKLSLSQASREMASEVGFVAAVPILQPVTDFYAPSPVCAIIYFDSRDEGFDLSDSELEGITILMGSVVDSIGLRNGVPLERLENTPLQARNHSALPATLLPSNLAGALIIPEVDPPRTEKAFIFNYDHSDLTPIAN